MCSEARLNPVDVDLFLRRNGRVSLSKVRLAALRELLHASAAAMAAASFNPVLPREDRACMRELVGQIAEITTEVR